MSGLSDDEIQALINAADVVAGRTVVPAEELVSVPFLITQLTFRHGSFGENARPWVSIEAIRLDTREEIVVNDGGSGLPANLAEYVAGKGLKGITTMGEVFDFADENVMEFVQGHTDNRVSVAVNLLAKNGTRISEYSHPLYGPSTTAYLG